MQHNSCVDKLQNLSYHDSFSIDVDDLFNTMIDMNTETTDDINIFGFSFPGIEHRYHKEIDLIGTHDTVQLKLSAKQKGTTIYNPYLPSIKRETMKMGKMANLNSLLLYTASFLPTKQLQRTSKALICIITIGQNESTF